MITIRLWHNDNGNISGFAVEGHAGYAAKGQDIVCAAVSAITQAALLGLTAHVGLNPEVEITEGYLSCILTPGSEENPAAQAILVTLALALHDIETQYPDRVRFKEVES